MRFVLQTYIVFSSVFFISTAEAVQPVLIEMYGSSYKCAASLDVEKEIKSILDNHSDAIFLNCRLKNPLTVNEIEPFGHEFCNQMRLGYFRSLETMVLNMPMVVVNGRYEANTAKVDMAVKAALSMDQVKKIDIRRTGTTLEISLDGVSSSGSKGPLLLYSYLPLQHASAKNEAPIDGDTYITTAASEVTFHPVINYTQLADWNGGPISFSHSLSGFVDSLYDPGSLGYIAVLHESSSSGPILAVGELKPEVLQVSTTDAHGPLSQTLLEANSQKENLPVTLPNQ